MIKIVFILKLKLLQKLKSLSNNEMSMIKLYIYEVKLLFFSIINFNWLK